MKLVNHKELHNDCMQDDEYSAVWHEEVRGRNSERCLLNDVSVTI